MKYNKLAINNSNDLIFGKAPFPVTTQNGLVIGDGHVYPELNFTLPMMDINRETMKEVKAHYREVVTDPQRFF